MTQQEPQLSAVVPVLLSALVCDTHAIDPTTGKKTLVGIFDKVWASAFPTGRPFSIYCRITDADGLYDVQAQFVQLSTGEKLGEAQGRLAISDRMASFDFIIPYAMAVFPVPGRYEMQLQMNGVYVGGTIIEAIKPDQGHPK